MAELTAVIMRRSFPDVHRSLPDSCGAHHVTRRARPRPVGRDHPATVAPSLAATFAATAAAFASAVAPRSASAAFSALVGRTRRRITASDAGQNEIPETAPIG